MSSHDCENCSKKGNCNIEKHFNEAKKVFESKGLPGLVDLLVASIKTPAEFAMTIRTITMVLDGSVDALHQFRVLTYQNKHRFPPGAGEYGLNKIFSTVHKVMSEEIIQNAIALTEKLAAALGVKSTMTAMKFSEDQLSEVISALSSMSAMSEKGEEPTVTKPLTFH